MTSAGYRQRPRQRLEQDARDLNLVRDGQRRRMGGDSISYSLSGAQSGSGTVPNGGTVTISARDKPRSRFRDGCGGNAESARTCLAHRSDGADALRCRPILGRCHRTRRRQRHYHVTGSDTWELRRRSPACRSREARFPSARARSRAPRQMRRTIPQRDFNVSCWAFVTSRLGRRERHHSPDSAQIIHLGTLRASRSHRLRDIAWWAEAAAEFFRTTYTTNPVMADCTVAATFTLITRTVTPSSGRQRNHQPGFRADRSAREHGELQCRGRRSNTRHLLAGSCGGRSRAAPTRRTPSPRIARSPPRSPAADLHRDAGRRSHGTVAPATHASSRRFKRRRSRSSGIRIQHGDPRNCGGGLNGTPTRPSRLNTTVNDTTIRGILLRLSRS